VAGDFGQAEELLERALKIQPSFSPALNNLGALLAYYMQTNATSASASASASNLTTAPAAASPSHASHMTTPAGTLSPAAAPEIPPTTLQRGSADDDRMADGEEATVREHGGDGAGAGEMEWTGENEEEKGGKKGKETAAEMVRKARGEREDDAILELFGLAQEEGGGGSTGEEKADKKADEDEEEEKEQKADEDQEEEEEEEVKADEEEKEEEEEEKGNGVASEGDRSEASKEH